MRRGLSDYGALTSAEIEVATAAYLGIEQWLDTDDLSQFSMSF